MQLSKYGKFVTREIIAESKYPQITTPIARYLGCRGGGNALTFEWSCITKPFVMDSEPEIENDCDRLLLFASTNLSDLQDFDAEVEIPLGKKGKKQIINESKVVYVPRGLSYGHVAFKKIKKPIALLSMKISPEFSVNWTAPDESKYLISTRTPPPPSMMMDDSPSVLFGPMDRPQRFIKWPPKQNYMLWGENLGLPVKMCMEYGVTSFREYAYQEPVHAHKRFHQISLYLGGNSLDIEDFNAEIDIWLGKEREKHVIDTCGVDHMVPGLVHLGDEVRSVGKPFIKVMFVVGTSNYFKSAATDKIQFSNEARGEVMLSKTADDYVPPSKIEDYKWP